MWVVDDKSIELVKIITKKNPADMMMKTILVEKFRASLNFIKVLQRYNGELALGRELLKSQKGGESTVNEAEVKSLQKNSMNMSQGGDC